tara:strand:+ start:73 stop:885 length:813 start_codon:yes stop_codon:yes gene_type:complete
MAKKKKYHPGGGVPPRKPIVQDGDRTAPLRRVRPPRPADGGPDGRTPPPLRRRRSLNKNTQLLKAKSLAMENQIAKELGYSSKAALNTALRNASPQEQRSLSSRLTTAGNRLQKQFNIDNKQLIADSRRTDTARRKKELDRVKRLYGDPRKQTPIIKGRRTALSSTSSNIIGGSRDNPFSITPMRHPLMPTAGMDARGRNIKGTTPMPGPAPDAARMRRMQKLMQEARKNFNTGRGPTGTGTPTPKNPKKLKTAKPRTGGGMLRPTRRRR